MPAYIIANQTITDPEAFGKYSQVAGPTVVAYGGKLLVAGPGAEVLEGNPSPATVVLEFESVEKAKAWYDSPEYQEIIGLRLASSTGWLLVAPQFVPPQS